MTTLKHIEKALKEVLLSKPKVATRGKGFNVFCRFKYIIFKKL